MIRQPMIICGTDYSPLAEQAAKTAAALAKKSGQPLRLVHVLTAGDSEAEKTARGDLKTLSERLRAGGATVKESLELGDPPAVLAKIASEEKAELIVVGSAGRRGSRWALGSTADRVISLAASPVLVVREGFPVEEWISGKRPLRIAVATDLSPSSDVAVDWAAQMNRYGTCEYAVMHVTWPPETYERLGIDGPMPLDQTHPLVEQVIRRDVGAAVELLQKSGKTEVLIESSFGKPADALAQIAAGAKADLLVVGHKLKRTWRVWEGSVARGVIRAAPMSVGCVPDVAAPLPMSTSGIQCIVAATDLSPHGNAAVAFALSLAPVKSRVIILHVMEGADHSAEERQRILDGLSELSVRDPVVDRGIDVRIEILQSEEPAEAIVAAAEREAADLICIAGRGRSRLPRILLGSVPQQVLLLSRRPVLIVP